MIAAAGAALLVWQWAGGRPLWLDEEMIAINLRDRSLGGLAGALSLGQTAPYGWLAIERLVVLLFGGGERALRFVPMACGVATLAVAVWIGRRWLGVLGAVSLVLLCSLGRWLTFYFLELKPYSADALFALWLPALAVLAVEDRRRARLFWVIAAVGQWFANGALLAAPAAAAVLAISVWRRDGARAVPGVIAPGALWLALFALHYGLVLRHALGSAFLQGTWAFAFPPPGATPFEIVRWLAQQLTPFAAKPGGTSLGLALWLAAALGFAAALAAPPRRSLAAAFALVPVSAFLLAALRLVPLYERVSIWVVPALYVGVALLADVAAGVARGFSPASVAVRAGGWIAVCAALILTLDISIAGAIDAGQRPDDSNRSLDDRAAIRWLSARHRDGDAWITTHFGLPALWWYGGSMSPPGAFELTYIPDRRECPADGPGNLSRALQPYGRVVVYLGFRFDDTPPGFDDLLVDRLSELGAVTDYRRFDTRGIGIVVDRGQPSNRPATLSQLDARPIDDAVRPEGCITIRAARSW